MNIVYFVSGFLICLLMFTIFIKHHRNVIRQKLLKILKNNSKDHLKEFIDMANKNKFRIYHLINSIDRRFRIIFNELQTQNVIFRKTFEELDIGVLIVNQEHKVKYYNTSLIGILNIDNIYLNMNLSSSTLDWILSYNSPFDVPIEFLKSKIHINCSIKNIILDEQYTIYKFVDVTEYRRLNDMSTEFISNVTHELKTPLTSIIGFSETLEYVDNDEDRKEFYKIINKEAIRLNNLISDVLILSDIEIKHENLKQKVDISTVLHEIKQLLNPQIDTKFNIIIDVPKITIISSENCLRQIILNIIDNSIKHSFGTEIKVWSVENKNEIKLILEDNGIGIPEDEINLIFKRFYKVSHSKSKSKGTGLGLSIVEDSIKKIGATINIYNNLNGLTFEISIPQKIE